MADPTTYLMDSDGLITAKNLYYAFDLCPGFLAKLASFSLGESVFSVD